MTESKAHNVYEDLCAALNAIDPKVQFKRGTRNTDELVTTNARLTVRHDSCVLTSPVPGARRVTYKTTPPVSYQPKGALSYEHYGVEYVYARKTLANIVDRVLRLQGFADTAMQQRQAAHQRERELLRKLDAGDAVVAGAGFVRAEPGQPCLLGQVRAMVKTRPRPGPGGGPGRKSNDSEDLEVVVVLDGHLVATVELGASGLGAERLGEVARFLDWQAAELAAKLA